MPLSKERAYNNDVIASEDDENYILPDSQVEEGAQRWRDAGMSEEFIAEWKAGVKGTAEWKARKALVVKKKNPEQINEGFYLDEHGNRQDAAFFDEDDFEWPLDYQIEAAKGMRADGYPDEHIKACYPLGFAELNK